MSKLTRIKRLLAQMGGVARSFIRWLKSRLLATVSSKAYAHLTGADPSGDPLQRLARRKLLEAQIEAAARQGLVPDGLAECLLNSFYDELEVRRLMLINVQHQLQACLLKLDVMAPPPKPEPEPRPEPPRPRKFYNFRNWLNGTPGVAK